MIGMTKMEETICRLYWHWPVSVYKLTGTQLLIVTPPPHHVWSFYWTSAEWRSIHTRAHKLWLTTDAGGHSRCHTLTELQLYMGNLIKERLNRLRTCERERESPSDLVCDFRLSQPPGAPPSGNALAALITVLSRWKMPRRKLPICPLIVTGSMAFQFLSMCDSVSEYTPLAVLVVTSYP